MSSDPRTLVMLSIVERPGASVVVTAANTGTSPVRGVIKACAVDRATLGPEQTPEGEFQTLKWGALASKFLVLLPGATKSSRHIKVSPGNTHIVVFGEGDNLMDCHCTVQEASLR